MMISRCENCKWHLPNSNICLLGRKEDNCDSPRARRGDNGLAVRLLDSYKEGRLQFEKLRQQEQDNISK